MIKLNKKIGKKELIQPQTKKNQTMQFKKWAKDLNRQFSRGKIQMAEGPMLSVTIHQRNAN